MWEEQVFNLFQCKFKVEVLSGAVLSCVVLSFLLLWCVVGYLSCVVLFGVL